MTGKNPKAIIFDLDDTLLPTSIAVEKYLETLAAGIGEKVNMSPEDVLDSFAQTAKKFGFLPAGNCLHQNDLMVRLCAGQDPRILFADQIKQAEKIKAKHLKPHSDVFRMLNQLQQRGCKLYIYTESTANEAVRKMCAAGIAKYFIGVFTAPTAEVEKDQTLAKANERFLRTRVREVSKSKPKQYESCWQEVLAQLPHDKHEIVMVGDHPVRDIDMAEKVGLAAYHSTWIIDPYHVKNFPAMAAMTEGAENLKKYMSKYQGRPRNGHQLSKPRYLLTAIEKLRENFRQEKVQDIAKRRQKRQHQKISFKLRP